MNLFKMSVWRQYLLLLIVGLLLSVPAQAKPFLWKIEDAKSRSASWVFGTIHIKNPEVNRFPASVQQAIDRADVVVTEIPLNEINPLEIVGQTMLPQGQSLKKILPARLWGRLDDRLKKTHQILSAQLVDQLQVWAVATTLLTVGDELKNPGLLAMDLKLANDAKRAGKQTGGLETINEQLAIFSQLSTAEQIQMLKDTLDVMDLADRKGVDPIKQLANVWLTGSEQKMINEMSVWQGDNQAFNEKFNRIAIDDRNVRMAQRMAQQMRQSPGKSFFFAVGTAHLLGDKSVQAYLKQMGYRLTRY